MGVTRQAHALGIKVLLKPHLWLRPPDWPGSIEPQGEDGWREWFRTYREFILHYAILARLTGMDAFCLGNELEKTTGHEREWRSVIAAVRAAYPGPLTYGAAFEEVFRVSFWDALDFIGVSAYYPLVQERSPDRALLAAAWKPLTQKLAGLAAARGRRIVFTELGLEALGDPALGTGEPRGAGRGLRRVLRGGVAAGVDGRRLLVEVVLASQPQRTRQQRLRAGEQAG